MRRSRRDRDRLDAHPDLRPLAEKFGADRVMNLYSMIVQSPMSSVDTVSELRRRLLEGVGR